MLTPPNFKLSIKTIKNFFTDMVSIIIQGA